MDDSIKKLPHSLILEERRGLTVSGVTDVGNFDEENITLYTGNDEIYIKGENLKVSELDTESGSFSAEGKISSVSYTEKKTKKNGFFGKVFR